MLTINQVVTRSTMRVKPADRTGDVQEYYFSRKLAQIEDLRRQGKDIINLGIGSPDLSPSETTIEALITNAPKQGVHGYQPYNGIPALRKAFAGWYSRYFNVELDPDSEILPLAGSKEGIMHISMAFVNEGDEVLIPDPGYPAYAAVTKLVGGIVRKYSLTEERGWLPDLDVLEENGLEKVKLMWVNYPHMPTGTKAPVELYRKIVSFATKHGILVCNDNPYSFILNKDYKSLLSVEGWRECALELNSLSKSQNMAGWRIGMVAGDKEYIKNILKVKSNMDSGMFLPLQMAAVEAINNPDSWYDSVNEIYGRRRKIAEDIMHTLQCRFNGAQSGMFLWGRIPGENADSEVFADEILLNAGVFITPGFIFGKNGERYIRISLCVNEDRLREARERIIMIKELK